MRWIESPNADEHVLCDAKGAPTEYRVRRDPMTSVWRAYDGQLEIANHLALYPCLSACEQKYAKERKLSKPEQTKRGRYSKPRDAA